MNLKQFRSLFSIPLALCFNLLLVYVCFMLCRLLFLWVNLSYFPDLTSGHLWEMLCGGLAFDTSAILYGNALVILLTLFPLHYKETPCYYSVVRWIYVGINMLMIVMNLMDTVYFRYSNRRTTTSVFSQFANEDNLGGIIGRELVHNWYLVLVAVALGYALYKFYRTPRPDARRSLAPYYLTCLLALGIAVPFTVFGMRGGIGRDVRPITISNASQYVDRPTETAIVLNTPFSILRTIGKKPFINPHYFSDEKEMTALFNPLHQPADSVKFSAKNVVVLVLESFGKEYFGSLNKDLEDGNYKGYTPFLDSLITKSLVYEHSFANGQQSIDGLPSVLSGIPRFVEPFFLTPASLNKLSGIGSELKKKGYYTAFFHGARDGSMGFQAYARAVGYPDYFGREEYGDDNDFDGNWAIWDEEFLQFFADKLSTFPQPFSVGIFTASSHHPYVIPERYKNVFPEGPLPIHKCILYSDHALKLFFEKSARQPWFKNTLFVLTADHTNQSNHEEYYTDAGRYGVPVIFYTPDGDLQGHVDAIAQQIDIMPTVLGYLGYDKPYVTFGCDLLHTPAEDTYAVNYNNGIYQYMKGDYMLQFDGEKSIAVYAFKTDKLLKRNLIGTVASQGRMELELKAIIQQYMERMNADRMTAD
ncbi:LTA synthase family protein [Bacteroides helcogenes]|uniref:Sulfatase n=1 Tax=Bacteroides helcogenes (strain ATCC 35417 / DSM 20613 / JCM 6297 / CCUG 15421 / P 36-108) TaxID=693979 RepID=E6SW41_BACT6|nr:alkaline phosphatase family protein [Bacteroides helcogenes]ADV42566.1 sulfatase [Bacteroides helcogenes P 36-108]MDY5237673.1 sulfatase-like hydrolase/transferase [Bacteroides helcogenes]